MDGPIFRTSNRMSLSGAAINAAPVASKQRDAIISSSDEPGGWAEVFCFPHAHPVPLRLLD